MRTLQFSGVVSWTILDFPDHLACILFTPGCNFRCGYCYNGEFVLPCHLEKLSASFISEETILRFLETRRSFLEGVVITGGEPLLHTALLSFLKKIKKEGWKVKLDTNGSFPTRLQYLIQERLIDYVAMDIKWPLATYASFVSSLDRFLSQKIAASIETMRKSGIPHEFRTTLIKGKHTLDQMKEMAKSIKGSSYYLQNFTNKRTLLDPTYAQYESFSRTELEDFQKTAAAYTDCHLR